MSGSGISWAICKSAPRCRQITMPAPRHSVFYRQDALPAAQLTASKHWRSVYLFNTVKNDYGTACTWLAMLCAVLQHAVQFRMPVTAARVCIKWTASRTAVQAAEEVSSSPASSVPAPSLQTQAVRRGAPSPIRLLATTTTAGRVSTLAALCRRPQLRFYCLQCVCCNWSNTSHKSINKYSVLSISSKLIDVLHTSLDLGL